MKGVVLGLLATAAGCAHKMPTPSEVAEPTGWSVCYDADGSVLNYDGNCDEPSLIQWSLPVEVYLPQEYPERLRFKQALVAWDSWLETEVFRLVATPKEADVTVVVGGPAFGIAGMAMHTKTGGKVEFHLSMYDPYYGRVDIIAHELGHVMGLAHDDYRLRSVMHPGSEWYLPELTPADCDYLKRLYNLSVECHE